jgi:monoamine oxidase
MISRISDESLSNKDILAHLLAAEQTSGLAALKLARHMQKRGELGVVGQAIVDRLSTNVRKTHEVRMRLKEVM